MMQSLTNERAAFAYDAVHFVVEKQDLATSKKYRSLVRSLPAMIQMQGLGATIAFLYSKKRDEVAHKILYYSIGDWCEKKFPLKNNELAKQIIQLDAQIYRMVTEEVLQIVLWKKRFAEGMIDNEK